MHDEGTILLNDLYNALYHKYNQPRIGAHVSDITLCSRESAFRRKNPQPVNATSLSFFTSGAAIGAAMQSLVESDPDTYKAEYEVRLGKLEGHVDLMNVKKNIPIELKSFNGTDMKAPKPHYLSQLRAYMAMTNATTGVVLVQILQHFKSKDGQDGKPFKSWTVTMTKKEIEDLKRWLILQTELFNRAVEEGKPELAPHIYYDTKLNWKCRYCDFQTECAAMRLKETSNKLAPCPTCGGLFTHKDGCRVRR